MKKVLLIILVCFCIVLTGCNYGQVGLVQNSDGSVVEYYFIPFPEEQLIANKVSIDALRKQILPTIKNDCNAMFTAYINDYKERVQNSKNYTNEEKQILLNGVTITNNLPHNLSSALNYYDGIRYEISFINSTCYQEFKNANDEIKEDKVIETTSNIFTTTTRVVKDPLFDKIAKDTITIGKKCLEYADKVMVNALGDTKWEAIKEELNYTNYSSKFTYTYIVPTARIHSNAQTVEKGEKGYYYHIWDIDLNNLNEEGESILQIQYWTVTANRPVWYVFGLIVAGTIAVITIYIGRKKEKEEIKQFQNLE